ncbi:MAG: COGs COG3558 [uncultured Nocardioidaceae bacterium]|uniref:COGs COG3558 n=1 Tax=uncultured Nocardioidaceae bacterium TaxID=253824 RepID=A0A6J4LYP2_9ACTN|nr:MAG: COGs COG3558 [uncultured Nocardioidaceae bacterium]
MIGPWRPDLPSRPSPARTPWPRCAPPRNGWNTRDPDEGDRLLRWDLGGPRPDDHPGLSDLDL